MRNPKLGKVVLGLSFITFLFIFVFSAIAWEINSGSSIVMTVASACTPTPTPTQTQTPTPTPTPPIPTPTPVPTCSCKSEDIEKLWITGPPANTTLFCCMQPVQSGSCDGAILSMFGAEDLDWIYDRVDNTWQFNTDNLKWTIAPSVNVTQAGENDVTVSVDDVPSTFTCPHGKIVKYFDDSSTSTGNTVKVIVTNIGIDIPDYETYDQTKVLQVGNVYNVELLAAEPASRVVGYFWSAYNGVFAETGTSSYYDTSATSAHIIPHFADTVSVTCEIQYYIQEANISHYEYASIDIEAYQAVLGLYADDNDGAPGVGVGHSWWELSFDPGNLNIGIFIPEQNLYNSLGVYGFWSRDFEAIGPGKLLPGDQGGHVASGSYQWYISLSDFRAALSYVAGMQSPNTPDYSVWTNNCTDIAIYVGEHAGITTMSASGLSTPDAFSDYLNSLYQ